MTEHRFYVGTYTQRGSEGIYAAALDLATGAIRLTGIARDQLNPSYITLHPSGRYLYAANETLEGAVAAYAVAPETGALTLLNRQASHGADPCHVSVAGEYLLVANYSGGSVAVLPIGPDGSLGEASCVVQHTGFSVTERQRGPHPHSIWLDPGGRWVYVPDLGLDRVLIYRLHRGALVPNEVPFVAMAPGAGPRHLALAGRYVYVINELDSTVAVCRLDPGTGALGLQASVCTLPSGFTGESYCADIHLHPSGRFLYASNRGHDSIAVFAVSPESGSLTAVGWQHTGPAGHAPAGSQWPRAFAVDPSGRFLVVANQYSDSVVSFRIDPENGGLAPAGYVAAVPAPVSIQFV